MYAQMASKSNAALERNDGGTPFLSAAKTLKEPRYEGIPAGSDHSNYRPGLPRGLRASGKVRVFGVFQSAFRQPIFIEMRPVAAPGRLLNP